MRDMNMTHKAHSINLHNTTLQVEILFALGDHGVKNCKGYKDCYTGDNTQLSRAQGVHAPTLSPSRPLLVGHDYVLPGYWLPMHKVWQVKMAAA
jgi:hypothetical protein